MSHIRIIYAKWLVCHVRIDLAQLLCSLRRVWADQSDQTGNAGGLKETGAESGKALQPEGECYAAAVDITRKLMCVFRALEYVNLF